MSESQTLNTNMPRRSFLKGLVLALLGLTGLTFAAPVVNYILPRSGKGGEDFLTSADGKPIFGSDIREGASFIGLSKDGPTIIIRRAGRLAAFSAVCTHLGCLVKWLPNEEVFLCPCHAGKFDANGVNISGPPPGPLPAYGAERDSADRIIIKKHD